MSLIPVCLPPSWTNCSRQKSRLGDSTRRRLLCKSCWKPNGRFHSRQTFGVGYGKGFVSKNAFKVSRIYTNLCIKGIIGIDSHIQLVHDPCPHLTDVYSSLSQLYFGGVKYFLFNDVTPATLAMRLVIPLQLTNQSVFLTTLNARLDCGLT